MDENFKILRKKIFSVFKISGFYVESETTNWLTNQLLAVNSNEHDKWMDLIIENIQNQKLNSLTIEKKHLEKALNEINQISLDDDTLFKVINAYDIPHFIYNKNRKKFELYEGTRNFFSDADKKAKYLQERYTMLYQKTSRHELFSEINEDLYKDNKKFKLTYVEHLLATTKTQEVVILGLLTQLTEGNFYLEDPTGAVKLNLKNAQYHSGFFCEGCFVLIEGKYKEGILEVNGLGFPPAESSISSQAIFEQNDLTFFKYTHHIMSIEKSNTEATIVFLSDVRLDVPLVMEKLRKLFIGYDDCPPVAMVLMGPFCKPDENNLQKMKQLFQSLGELSVNCERLKRETDLILIPSLEDESSPSILPKPPIPESLVENLKRKWNRVKLATNPCRLKYCSQQIVVCRVDLVTKFCRNTLHFPEDGKIEDHFARTLVCQGHLAPIHSNALPVYWEYDSALWLYPLPDLIVIGDQSNSFSTTQLGCSILNTGSFLRSKFSFKVYVPSTRTIEDSEVPSEEN